MASQSLDAAIGRLASAQYGVFSWSQAVALGATESTIRTRLSSGKWDRVRRGVYRVNGAPSSWRQQLIVACLSVGVRAAAGHLSAAHLWRLRDGRPLRPEILVPQQCGARLHGVTVRRTAVLEPIDRTRVEGIPVTTPERTLIDCAGLLNPSELEEALEEGLRRGLLSLARLRWRLDELSVRGRAGVAVLRPLLQARRGGEGVTGSVLETRFLQLARGFGLPDPVRQHVIRDRGRVVAVPDFAYPAARLAIEVDGWRYHSGRTRWQHDLARRNALTSRGWRVLHVTADDLRLRPGEICGTIRRALDT